MTKFFNTLPILMAVLFAGGAEAANKVLTNGTWTLEEDAVYTDYQIGKGALHAGAGVTSYIYANGFNFDLRRDQIAIAAGDGGKVYLEGDGVGYDATLINADNAKPSANGNIAAAFALNANSFVQLKNVNISMNDFDATASNVAGGQFAIVANGANSGVELIGSNNYLHFNSGNTSKSAMALYAVSGAKIDISGYDIETNENVCNSYCYFSNNSSATINLTDVDIDFNDNYGYGIYGNALANGSVTTFTDSVFNMKFNESPTNVYANYIAAGGKLIFNNSTIDMSENNNGSWFLGVYNSGETELTNSKLSANGNIAGAFSAIYNLGTTTITDSTVEITGNKSMASNGATYGVYSAGDTSFINTDIDISGNTAIAENLGMIALNGGSISIDGGEDRNNLTINQDAIAGLLVAADSKISVSNMNVSISGSDALAFDSNGEISLTNTTLNSAGAGKYAAYSFNGVSELNLTGSELISADNKFLKVENSNITIDAEASYIKGASILTGDSYSELNLTSNSLWEIGDNSVLTDLNIDNSTVDIRSNSGKYNNLIVRNYTGSSSLLKMNTYLGGDNSPTDVLVIDGGSAAGNTVIDIFESGTGAPTVNGIKIVDAQNGALIASSAFTLEGGQIDSGAYIYKLYQGDVSGNDRQSIFLRNTSEPTDIAKTLGNVSGIYLGIVDAGMDNLRERMGELRNSNGNHLNGAWVKTYGQNLRVKDGLDSKMNIFGVEGGYDRMVYSNADNKVFAGVMAGYSYTDNIKTQQDNGFEGDGEVKSPSAGIYATWVNNSGWFADGEVRHFWNDMKMKSYTAKGDAIEYNPDRDFIAASLEFGRQIAFNRTEKSKLIIEPKVAFGYAYSQAKNFVTNTGKNINYDKTESFTVNPKIMFAYNEQFANGTSVQPFVELGVSQEMMGTTNYKYAGAGFKGEGSSTTYEVAAGVNAKINDSWNLYNEISYEFGNYFQGLGGEIGVRYSW